jgi:two-component system OmpR family sensor kinase
MKRGRWLILLLPAIIGVAISLVLSLNSASDRIVYLRANLGSLALVIGLGASTITGVAYAAAGWSDRLRHRILAEAAAERRRFLRRLDHELKNPLTAIRVGLANMAESPTDKARDDAFASVEAQTLRLSRLSADLRKLAELEVRLLERSPVDTSGLLREAFAMAQDQSGAADRLLTLTIPQAPWPLPQVTGDPDLLLLAVHNLMENAIKFTRPGDRIELRAYEDGTTLVIEVADTGAGIPEEEQQHVWEELYRGEAGRSVPGSGLGLALVRAIAERHQAQVGVRSRVGQGTVFTLRLHAG